MWAHRWPAQGADVTKQLVRVGLCGLGSIGSAAARLLLDYRTGFDLVGATTKQPDALGKNLNAVVGSAKASDVVVGEDLDSLLALEPDIILYATGSFLAVVADDLDRIVDAGSSIVTPCEEVAFPFTRDAAWADKIDAKAKAASVTVLGTGVNPGFIFDGLLAAATGSAWDVLSIRGRRVVDVSGFAQNIHLRLGIGYTAEQFAAGHADGSIAGHVGFPESIQLVMERLGLQLDGPVEELFEPLLAEHAADTPYGGVPAESTEGFIQRAIGRVGGKPFIELELVLHLRPVDRGYETCDRFSISGVHPVNVEMKPGMDAIPATAAQLVNSIPGVLHAPSGLKTIKDIPAASAWTDLSRRMLR